MFTDRTPFLSDDEKRRVFEAIDRFWGFRSLRPLQEAAIAGALRGRDSLTVLPTGGGKSLCYQVPPLLSGNTDVVVSPLISLMKDQVDGLRTCGYPAAALHSGLPPDERREVLRDLAEGKLRLIFAAPERLLTDSFLRLLAPLNGLRFAIDEAHCISHWGHDFRQEYRRLAELRERFPNSSIHAFTATATQRVREDIVAQLRLRDAAVLVGSFDRPNLVYRIVPRVDLSSQVLEIIRRHAGEAIIIYCLSRRDTEELAADLQDEKVSTAAYHAGLAPDVRRRVQDAFAAEKLDVVVATVAFGMGIDRSNVRSVIHACVPKTIEHYQQETGRAGRDGLPAECVMLYSAQDTLRWESLIAKSAEDAERPREVVAAAIELLAHIQRFCNTIECRHRAILRYFGESYERPNCRACDVCLGEVEGIMDATLLAQKILSCVVRVEERFGLNHVVDVLVGADTEQVRKCGHERLSTYGLLTDIPRKSLVNLVYQLVDQELLVRTKGERPVLRLNASSWEVLRKQREVMLLRPKAEPVEATGLEQDAWVNVDRGLFEHLRIVRKGVAEERSVPAYVIFGDATLRHMARIRPSSGSALASLPGIGQRKLADLGGRFLTEIAAYCRIHKLSMDSKNTGETVLGPRRRKRPRRSASAQTAARMFAKGRDVEAVAAATGKKRSTVFQYLAEFIEAAGPERIDCWVDEKSYRTVIEAVRAEDGARLRPIFDRVGGAIPYEIIKLVLAHRRAHDSKSAGRNVSTPPSTQC